MADRQASRALGPMLRAIALQNVADLDPPRWASWLLATHPSTGERIGAALAFEKRAGEARP